MTFHILSQSDGVNAHSNSLWRVFLSPVYLWGYWGLEKWSLYYAEPCLSPVILTMTASTDLVLSMCQALCRGYLILPGNTVPPDKLLTPWGRCEVTFLLWVSWITPWSTTRAKLSPFPLLFKNSFELKCSRMGRDMTQRPSQRGVCHPRESFSGPADLNTGPSVTFCCPVQTLSQVSGNLLARWTAAGPSM